MLNAQPWRLLLLLPHCFLTDILFRAYPAYLFHIVGNIISPDFVFFLLLFVFS